MFFRRALFYLDKVKYFGLRKAYYLARDFFSLVFYRMLFWADFFSPRLTSRFLSRRIIDYFDGDSGHNVGKKKTFLGFGLLHYALVRNIRPKKILCIGSRKGFIPAVLALACKDNQFGQVDFVDAGYEESHPKSWAGIGFWKKIDSKKHFRFLGLNSWITTYLMTSKEFVRQFPKRKYGYIYIDGDHSYEGVKLDYNLFWPKLEENGLMVFHDVIVKEWGKLKNFGVWKLWHELKDKNKIIFPFPRESGLGILQKRG